MKKTRMFMFLFGLLVISYTSVMAQFTLIDAEQLRSYLTGNKKVALVDSRTSEEYQQAHIPGAINIMPDQMRDKAPGMLKDKAELVIFYCRGME